jgi:hypothetical protein
MSESDESPVPIQPEVLESDSPELKAEQQPPSEREVSTTVGTGSYVAVSCTAVMLFITLIILAVMLLIRWLT